MDQTRNEPDRRARCYSASSPVRPSTILSNADRSYASTMQSAVLGDDSPATRLRAIEDAALMHDIADKQCYEAGIETPPYKLTELIGKGSFGRVYKATASELQKTVAVKIMSIEEGDSLAPGRNDTFAEVLKEVTTLRTLNDGGAKNVNRLIDCILVGHSMWVVTEYCAGGSVATLMRPTGCLPEKWVIPVLREVAEALFWVHKHGIIHRDLKCANVLVTEEGAVQLCDFGVAGIIKSKVDKRSTITGTLQWMAPELFGNNVAYGNEVDIWAFGSLAYEAATGFPPNATTIFDMDLGRFGAYLKESCPRLEGDEYSDHLKDLISFCMVADPAKRPTIEQLQRHPYIFDSQTNFPTSSLKDLVSSYKEWEKRGGNRQSLFNPGGAQCQTRSRSMSAIEDAGWDYGTMDQADQVLFDQILAADSQALPKARPHLPRLLTRGQQHRRRLPADVNAVRPPLAKAFDPNTMLNYQDHVKAFYQQSSPTGDPPPSSTQMLVSPASIRDASNYATIRESPIGTGIPLRVSPISPDDDLTIKPPRNQSNSAVSSQPPRLQLDFDTCRTQDWRFPVMLPDFSSDPKSQNSGSDSAVSPTDLPSMSKSSSRTFSVGGMDVAVSPVTPIHDSPWSRHPQRADGLTISSRISLIDLDASLVSNTPPDVKMASTYNINRRNHTEKFPELSSPPTNGTSLAPIQDSSSPAPDIRHYTNSELSSSPLTFKSPISPSNYDYTSNYRLYQARDLPTSSLLASQPAENGVNSHQSTHVHHQHNDSGYYPSAASSISGSKSRVHNRADSLTQPLIASCETALQFAHSCTGASPCPAIDETSALDETPPRYRFHRLGKHDDGFEARCLQREPSLYVPCEESEDEAQNVGDGLGEKKTDVSHRELFLPRMILESRPGSDSDAHSSSASNAGEERAPGGGNRGDVPSVNGGMAKDLRRRSSIGTELAKKLESLGKDNDSSKGFVPGPPLPDPPSVDALSGTASREAMKDELTRLLGSMASHLQHSATLMMQLPVVGPPLLPSVVKNNGAKSTGSSTGVARGRKRSGSKKSSG